MLADSLQSKIFQIVSEQLSVQDGELHKESRFVEDLGADSLDIVELVMELEEEFKIEIPDQDVEKMQSLQDAMNYIGELVSQEQA